MLKIIEDEAAVKKYRRQFIKSFKPLIDDKIQVQLGHPGGAFMAKVFWSNRLGIWIFHQKVSQTRCGHAFGVGKPTVTSTVPITCEINFPARGVDRRMGGALAKDRDGRIFVVHRGKIGGGKKGVGKSLFDKYYRGAWAVMEDGFEETPVALVGALHSPRFARQVAQFVRKVERIKDVISYRSPQMEITFDELRFREELTGTGYDGTAEPSDSDCDRGLIVSDLYDTLTRKGYRSGNDSVRDLFVVNSKRKIAAVFQVIADYSPASLYPGISKLLLNSVDLPDKPCLILIVPEGLEPSLTEKLKKLGIDILEYKWQDDQAVFPGIARYSPFFLT
jgi:hypothetical protein